MGELTAFGFERDNRTDIISKLSVKFRNKFGNDILLTDDSVAGMLLAIMAEGRLEVEKLAEDVYYSRTLNGAEGVYLDDALSFYNFPRLGKIAGSGDVQVNYDAATTASSAEIDDTYSFSADNGVTYVPTSTVVLSQSVVGFYVDASTLPVGSYEFNITNTETLEVVTESFSISSATTPDYEAFCDDIVGFFLANTTDNANSVYRLGTEVYIGYNNVQSFTGISESTFFRTVPKIGELWSEVSVEATEKGFNELEAGGISDITPTFTGYIASTNVIDFYAGAENETDTEYRARFVRTRGSFPAATREGLLDELRLLDGVEDVVIYDNPSLIDTTEADALTFNTVVKGGSNQSIAKTIYDNKPVNSLTSGTVSIPVDTSDNDVESISFSKASAYPADMRITYRLGNTTPLSASERQAVTDNINNLLNEVNIGDTIYNTQIVSAVLSALKANRLISVTVEIKRSIEPEESYGVDDIRPLYFEYVEVGELEFNRII